MRLELVLLSFLALFIGDLSNAKVCRDVSQVNLARFEIPTPNRLKVIIENSLRGRTNEMDAYLTWGSSYDLQALINLYLASCDKEYLSDFVLLADDILAQRDNIRGVGDQKPVWSSTYYSQGKYLYFANNVGRITYPLAEFSYLIFKSKDDSLIKAFEGRARAYAEAAALAVEAIDSDWNKEAKGYGVSPRYSKVFLDSRGRAMSDHYELPYNMQHSLGLTLVLLSQNQNLSPELRAKYKTRALEMVTNFLGALKKSNLGQTYFWPYWSRDPGSSEDVSHGAVTVLWLTKVSELLKGIDQSVLMNLSSTFLRNIVAGISFNCFVDGQKCTSGASDFRDATAWLPLTPYSLKLKNAVMDRYKDKIVGESGYSLLSKSYLLLYGSDL